MERQEKVRNGKHTFFSSSHGPPFLPPFPLSFSLSLKKEKESPLSVAPRPLRRRLVVPLPVREELLRDGADERVLWRDLKFFFFRR